MRLNGMMGGAVYAGLLLAGFTAQAKPSATVTPAGDLKWVDVPTLAGVHMAVAEGDPTKGPSVFFVRFDKGFTSPEHHHSPDYVGVVLAGTLLNTVDGKDISLPAGSYFSFKG